MTTEELYKEALRRIAFGHLTVEQQRERGGLAGLSYVECLELAYNDLQNIAKRVLKGELRSPLAELMFTKEELINSAE